MKDFFMNNEKIYLRWSKIMNESYHNFGDDLSPYIVNRLSGKDIFFVRFANERFIVLYRFFIGIIKGKYRINDINSVIKSLFIKRYIISVGSIIQSFSSSRCEVWGAGIISRKDKIRNSIFLAVRGEYTKKRLTELGYQPPQILGDPALLLPLVYPAKKKEFRFGIIPHIIHYDYIKKRIKYAESLIIKLDDSNLEKIIDDICSCEYTISSSLHGLIVSHAYGIRSLWFKLDEHPLGGDNVKFYDYFSSVNIKEYNPFDFSQFLEADLNEIVSLIKNSEDINMIKKDIRIIQRDLLSVAPFKVLDEYLELVKNI